MLKLNFMAIPALLFSVVTGAQTINERKLEHFQ